MPSFIDLSGQRFGRLLVVRRAENHIKPDGKPVTKWECICDCGRQTRVSSGALKSKSGPTESCGCLRLQRALETNISHGESGTREYQCWRGMMDRCYSPNNPNFRRYGLRGIAVCERWHDVRNFIADMGRCAPGLQIERIDNDGDYCPQNCIWADRTAQMNNRSVNSLVTLPDGRRLTIAQASRETGLLQVTISYRLRKGVVGAALFAPARRCGPIRGTTRRKNGF